MWKAIDIFAQPAHFYLISPFWIPPPFIKHFFDHPSFSEILKKVGVPLCRNGGLCNHLSQKSLIFA